MNPTPANRTLLFVPRNTRDLEEHLLSVELVGDQNPHAHAEKVRVGHRRPVVLLLELIPTHHTTLRIKRERNVPAHELVHDVDQNGVHSHSAVRVPAPHFQHVHQHVRQTEHAEANTRRDGDKTGVPLVLVDRHVPIELPAQQPRSQQERNADLEINPNALPRVLDGLEDLAHERAQEGEEDGVHNPHEALALEVVSSVHVGDGSPMIDMLLA